MAKRISLLVIGIAAIGGLLYFADFELLAAVLATMPAPILALLIGFFLAASLMKGLRWAFYLRAAHLDIRWRDGVTSYIAAFATSAIPGGSWLAPRLAQEHGRVRMRQAAAALFVSFIGDALAISSAALVLFIITEQPAYRFLVPVAGLAIGFIAIAMGRSALVWTVVARTLDRWRLTRRLLPKERDIQSRIQVLMRPKVIAGGVAFSLSTTALTIGFLYVLVNALTFRGISVIESAFVLSTAEATAVVIPFTGGFGVTDSSMAGMMTTLAIGLQRATFVALMFRSIELLFKMLLGIVVLFLRYDEFLLNVLDLRARSRDAYKWISYLPGVYHLMRSLGLVASRSGVTISGAQVPIDEHQIQIDSPSGESGGD
ncbi:MAG: lysylphosphatidylglycerol synthase transmembrane domain-containing protein [Chloroflexota bacterium]